VYAPALDPTGSNKNFARVTGYTAAEIVTMHPRDFFAGLDKELVAARIRDVFEDGESSVEAGFVSKDGRVTPYYFTGTKTSIDGQICLVGVGIDITDRKRADAERQASDARYRALFEYAPDGIVIADSETYYLDANASMCRMLGYSPEELIGMHASQIVVDTESQHIAPALSAIKASPTAMSSSTANPVPARRSRSICPASKVPRLEKSLGRRLVPPGRETKLFCSSRTIEVCAG
jgi:PAS domain S-box-containing protein